jgi:tRNA G10  N-methylase Trm11
MKRLRANSEIRIEKFRQTMLNKRNDRLDKIYNEEKKKFHKISKRERFIAGLALYWGEGKKSDWATTGVTNTDPQILQFFIKWLEVNYGINKKSMRVALQLYNDMDIKKENNYWAEKLKITQKQFIKPYIKNSNSLRINHKGSFGHGTCTIVVYGVELKQKIMMQLKILAEI